MSAKNNSSYVPPSMRSSTTTAFTSTKKKEPQKEFSTKDHTLFPSLGETLKKNANNALSFSSAASKKIEPPKVKKADVEPGWVHIRKINNNKSGQMIEYKYGAAKPRDYKVINQEAIALGNLLFKYRLEKEQYERDSDIIRLGDLSEYYGELTLAEQYENDIAALYEKEHMNNSYSESSDVETF
jgi:hypothetical protein